MPPSTIEAESAILRLVSEAGPGRSVSPNEVARALTAGQDWQRALAAVRRAAVRLALAGQIAIYRKGRVVDPADFKGVYRLGLPPPR